MTLLQDCTGTSSYCQASFTVPDAVAASGSLVVNVGATNGKPGCLPAGQTNCSYSVLNNVLSFSCGGATLSYQK